MSEITTCLWFDQQAEEAARFYTSIFSDGRLGRIVRYGKAGQDIHGMEEGTVVTVEFAIRGRTFTALNGGPIFRFNEAVSFQVHCDTQDEIDYYWNQLAEGGDESAQQCGWLKDRYGLSWQIVPTVLPDMLSDPDPARSERVMQALLQMQKPDIQALRDACDGG